jgi:hypothetical protein
MTNIEDIKKQKKEPLFYFNHIFSYKKLQSIVYRIFFSIDSIGLETELEIGVSKYSTPRIGIQIEYGGDKDVTISLTCLFFIYFSFNLPKKVMEKFKNSLPVYEYDREIQLAIHHNTIWWRFWVSESRGCGELPIYRYFNFNFLKFLLGNSIYESKYLDEGRFNMYLDEGVRNVLIMRNEDSWIRERFKKTIFENLFKLKLKRFDIYTGFFIDKNEETKYIDNKFSLLYRNGNTGKFTDSEKLDRNKDYQIFVVASINGVRKLKWDSDSTQGGYYYFGKDIDTVDKAFVAYYNDTIKNKMTYSNDKFRIV